jgi:hypothetical protein
MEAKLDNQLNLALELSPQQREKSYDLNVGYDQATNVWEVIFRYVGSLEEIDLPENIQIEPLTMSMPLAGCRKIYWKPLRLFRRSFMWKSPRLYCFL